MTGRQPLGPSSGNTGYVRVGGFGSQEEYEQTMAKLDRDFGFAIHSGAIWGRCLPSIQLSKTTSNGLPSRKRALDLEEDDAASPDEDGDDDEEEEEQGPITENCDQIRRKINALINSGEMKVTHFQRECGINSNSYGRFMKLKGPYAGDLNQTYEAAFRFFEKRKREGVKEPTRKKAKQEDAAQKLDVSGVKLDGEEDGSIPVYDLCAEIRRKINALLRSPGVTKAAFVRELKKSCLPAGSGLSAQQIDRFLKKTGPVGGNQSSAYYGAYVFFEKQRIAQGKAKSKHRLECEKQWPAGVDTDHSLDGPFICRAPPRMNEWGHVFFD